MKRNVTDCTYCDRDEPRIVDASGVYYHRFDVTAVCRRGDNWQRFMLPYEVKRREDENVVRYTY